MKQTYTEQAAQEYAYKLLERNSPDLLTNIEKDLAGGVSPARIESIWLRSTGQDQMSKMVGLAAQFIEAQKA